MPGNILRGRTMDRFVNIISVLLSSINDSCLDIVNSVVRKALRKMKMWVGFRKQTCYPKGFIP